MPSLSVEQHIPNSIARQKQFLLWFCCRFGLDVATLSDYVLRNVASTNATRIDFGSGLVSDSAVSQFLANFLWGLTPKHNSFAHAKKCAFSNHKFGSRPLLGRTVGPIRFYLGPIWFNIGALLAQRICFRSTLTFKLLFCSMLASFELCVLFKMQPTTVSDPYLTPNRV